MEGVYVKRKLGIFGGTYEGRRLVEFCQKEQIPFAVSVATAYGEQLLEYVREMERRKERVEEEIHSGRMDAREMADWMREQAITDVVDATHPFAEEASRQIRLACGLAGVDYHRLKRAELEKEMDAEGLGEQKESIWWVSSFKEAAKLLHAELLHYPERKALLTTGSKELSWFSAKKEVISRIFVRVLPSVEAIGACTDAGFCGKQIIAMQGPFSCVLNREMLRAVGASYLVTKESGRTGGFEEKVQAALESGCQVIAVRRPDKGEEGKSLEETERWLSGWRTPGKAKEGSGVQHLGEPLDRIGSDKASRRELFVVGIGMGGLGQLTLEGLEVLLRADAFLGARRMVESGKAICREALHRMAGEQGMDILRRIAREKGMDMGKRPWIFPEDKRECITWKKEELLSWIELHTEVQCPAVLFSGDIGFYSGAGGLLELLNERLNGQYRVRVIPGISTLSYLAAKIGRTWEGVEAVSFHGREEMVDWTFSDGRERFFLLDGTERLRQICCCLMEHGQAEAKIWVGENLSYPEEKIISGKPQELLAYEFGTLLAAWVIPGAVLR